MITRGRGNSVKLSRWTLSMKYLSICSVTSKSLTTPSTNGRVATMCPGVLPTIFLASLPMAKTCPVFLLIATTDGSLMTIPLPLTYTSVLAVPRSMPISLEKLPKSRLDKFLNILLIFFMFVYFDGINSKTTSAVECFSDTYDYFCFLAQIRAKYIIP